MRRVKLQIQQTVNGYVAGPNGELDWMVWDWDSELQDYVGALTDSIDTILMGRKMTTGFCSHWESIAEDPENPEYESARRFVELPKIVFSQTVKNLKWKNVTVAKMDLKDEVARLKSQEGKDLMVYGGATFVSNLIKEQLIDDYYLFVNPVAIKNGLTIFGNISEKLHFDLVDTKSFRCGIVLLHAKSEAGR
jgi:dihydrofolate reductase